MLMLCPCIADVGRGTQSRERNAVLTLNKGLDMEAIIVAAIGYSLIYLLLGGGLGGAVLIFIIAKMLGR